MPLQLCYPASACNIVYLTTLSVAQIRWHRMESWSVNNKLGTIRKKNSDGPIWGNIPAFGWRDFIKLQHTLIKIALCSNLRLLNTNTLTRRFVSVITSCIKILPAFPFLFELKHEDVCGMCIQYKGRVTTWNIVTLQAVNELGAISVLPSRSSSLNTVLFA